jgi:molybdopterin molybdotransferase
MPLLPVADAVARIVSGVTPLESESVALADALGRTLAETVAARRTQPPFPASAMDGYAVRSGDLADPGATLMVTGMAAAGHAFPGTVGPGETVRIFTGAPVPDGADAVLIQEDADAIDPRTVRARQSVRRGQNVRPAGLDFHEGENLLAAGRALAMREIAAAAAMNHPRLPVRRRPRVAILATGDELVRPGDAIGRDQIVASNGYALAASARTLGAEPVDLGIARDDPAAIGAAIAAALALPADILVTLGGASVGDHDLVRDALVSNGMDLDFWRIAMRPGKPLMFGRLARPGGTPMRVLGLPGNPVSSIVCAILFLRPLVAALLGQSPPDDTEPAILAAGLPANDTRQDYLRATLAERPGAPPLATSLSPQDSSMLSVLLRADCLIVRPPQAPAAMAGDPCTIIRLP